MKRSIIIREPGMGNFGDAWVLHFKILKKKVNLINAIYAVCRDYGSTPEGDRLVIECGDVITWKDFWEKIPNELCQRHGFSKQKREVIKESHDWDECIYSCL